MARGERGRSVRVFTVAAESRYLVVCNVPALGVLAELLQRLNLYGKVCEHRVLDHPDDRRAALRHAPRERKQHGDAQHSDSDDAKQRFTDVVWVQYETVNNARHAKARAGHKPFFGSKLALAYAPHFESRADTASKLAQRRQLLQRRARPNSHASRPRPSSASVISSGNRRSASSGPPAVIVHDNFIGPQLPWRAQQQVLAPATGPAQHRQIVRPPLPGVAATQATSPTTAPKAKRRRI